MTLTFAWLWQGLALWMLTLFLLSAGRRVNGATRYVVWWVTLGAVLLVPLVISVMGLAGAEPTISGRAPAPASSPWALPTPPDWLMASAVGVWLGWVGVGLARILGGWRVMRRLRAGSSPVPAEQEARLALWTASRDTGRRIEVRVSSEVSSACALGLGQPVILLPHRYTTGLTDEALDQIVMHEKAHLDRYDDCSRFLQVLVETVAGLHPAVSLIGRQLEFEREAACDDAVVARTGSARRYAACLVEAATLATAACVARSPASGLVPAATRSRFALRARVSRLLRTGHLGVPRVSPAYGVAACIGLGSAIVGLATCEPMVTFGEPVAPVRSVEQSVQATIAAVGVPSGQVLEVPAARLATADRERSAQREPRPAPGAPRATQDGWSGSTEQGDSRPALVAVSLTHQTPLVAGADPVADAALRRVNTLEARSAAITTVVSLAPLGAGGSRLPVSERGPWMRFADAGSAIGTGGKKTGVSVASFFARASKGAAAQF